MPAPTLVARATTAARALARWVRPAGPALRWALGRVGTGLRAGGRLARRHRRPLRAIGLRVAWWTALLLLVLGGRPVLGLDPVPARWLALAPFVGGLVLCAALRLLAPHRHLRVAALGLGALHGTAVALVWTAFA